MESKSILLIGAARVAMGFIAPVAFAADTPTKPVVAAADTSPPSAMEHGAAQAGTNIQKAVGAKDTFTPEEAAALVAITSVDKSNTTLMAAKVDDPQGNVIGTVKKVKTDQAGRLPVVHVDVGAFLGVGGRVVEMPTVQLSYMPSRNIVFTNATKAQIETMNPVPDKTPKEKAT